MQNRRTILASASMLLMVGVATSACSSSGSTLQVTSSANSTVGASPGATDSGATGSQVTLPAGGGGSTGGSGSGSGSGSGGSSQTTAPSSKHTTSAPKSGSTPTPQSTALPEIVSVSFGTPGCTTQSGMSTVTLTWKTKYVTSLYLGESELAFYADPKDNGGFGPLSANGSKTMPFNCTYQYEYYMFSVYNSTGAAGKQGETQQVPNPVYKSSN